MPHIGLIQWQLRVSGSLVPRSDTGHINSSPITDMLPVVHLQQGCGQAIRIPGITVSVEVCALGGNDLVPEDLTGMFLATQFAGSNG